MSELPPIDPTVREGYGPERDRSNYSIGEWIVDTLELAEQGKRGDVFDARKNLRHIIDNLAFLASRLVVASPELRADLEHAVETHPNHEIHEDFLVALNENLKELRARTEGNKPPAPR